MGEVGGVIDLVGVRLETEFQGEKDRKMIGIYEGWICFVE